MDMDWSSRDPTPPVSAQRGNPNSGCTCGRLTRHAPPVNASASGRLLTAEQVADLFQCTPSRIKERARRREIPFVMIAGQYRFSHEHLAEIVRIFKTRPEGQVRHLSAPRRRTTASPSADSPTTALRARRSRQPT